MKALLQDRCASSPPLLPTGQLALAIDTAFISAGDLQDSQAGLLSPDNDQGFITEFIGEYYLGPGLFPVGVITGADISVVSSEEQIDFTVKDPVAKATMPIHY